MSELVCMAFKDSSTADRVLNELRAMETDYVLDTPNNWMQQVSDEQYQA